jgi:hypothetical protein
MAPDLGSSDARRCMTSDPTMDVRLRVVVWEDGYQTKVSYPSPTQVARRFGIDSELAAGLDSIDTVISTVVDR